MSTQNIANISIARQSRTKETLEHYLWRARKLELLARRTIAKEMNYAINKEVPVSPMQLAVWVIERMRTGKISSATYRQYKSALIASFEMLPSSQETSDAIDTLRATQHVPGVKPQYKTASARKSKTISMDDLVRLCEFMQAREGRFNYLASMWLVASYHTGLRPCEWEFAKTVYVSFQDDAPAELALLVKNAKNTNGRSHGTFRHVPLMHLDTYSRETVIAFLHLLAIELESTAFKDIQNNCKCAIYNNSRRLFSKRSKGVSMYTMRHQFSANAKNSLTLKETGALMGHAVADTAKQHYARARSGVFVNGIKAMTEEVNRVKKETPNRFTMGVDQVATE